MRKPCAAAAGTKPSKPRSTIACRVVIENRLTNRFWSGSVVAPTPEIIRASLRRRLLPAAVPRLEQPARHRLGRWRRGPPTLIGKITPPGGPPPAAAIAARAVIIRTLIGGRVGAYGVGVRARDDLI